MRTAILDATLGKDDPRGLADAGRGVGSVPVAYGSAPDNADDEKAAPGDILDATGSPDGASSGRGNLGVPDFLRASRDAGDSGEESSEESSLREHVCRCAEELPGLRALQPRSTFIYTLKAAGLKALGGYHEVASARRGPATDLG